MNDRFSHDVYVVRKKIFKLLGAAFHIYDASESKVLFYSKQKAFKLKEDIRLYTGEDMQEEVLSIKARQVIDISASYDVVDPTTEEKIGTLRRKGLKSFIRDEWLLLDENDQEIGLIQEDNAAIALIRRFVGFAALVFPQKYHGMIGDKAVCNFQQNFNPFVLKITLDYSVDSGNLLDRRLGIAAAVLLCAIEGRQG